MRLASGLRHLRRYTTLWAFASTGPLLNTRSLHPSLLPYPTLASLRLGIADSSCFLHEQPDFAARRVEMGLRDPKGTGKAAYTTQRAWDEDVVDALGGVVIFASAEEYIKVLHELLADDRRLLQAGTIELMFQPPLTEDCCQAMIQTLDKPVNQRHDGCPANDGEERLWCDMEGHYKTGRHAKPSMGRSDSMFRHHSSRARS